MRGKHVANASLHPSTGSGSNEFLPPPKSLVPRPSNPVPLMPIQFLANLVLLATAFFLSWQTRYIASEPLLNGGVWEYGKISFYVVEIFVIVAALLRGWPKLREAGFVSLLRFGVFLGAAFLSVGASSALPVSIAAVTHLLIAGLLFLLVLDERLSRESLARAFVLGLLPGAFLGLFQVASGISPAASWMGLASHMASDSGVSVVAVHGVRILRAYGFLPHPNIFGGYLVMGTFLAVWLSTKEKAYVWRFIATILALVLVLTFSRSAWLGLGLGLAGAYLAYEAWQKNAMRIFVKAWSVPVIAILLTSLCFFGAIATRTFQGGEAVLENRSVSERVTGYHEAVALIAHHPLTGVGIGAFTSALSEVRPDEPSWSYQPVHNTPLLILAELGPLGLITCLWWLLSVVKPHTSVNKKEAAMGRALLLALSIPFLFDHYLFSGWWGVSLAVFTIAFALRFFLAEEEVDYSRANGE